MESRTQQHDEGRDMRTNHQRPHTKRDLTTVRTELKEFTLVSFNVRGLNGEAKQKIVYDLLKHNRPQVVCFNETKLQTPLYLGGFWSYQTLLQRNGGCWNASRTGSTRLQLVKALGTYLCWT